MNINKQSWHYRFLNTVTRPRENLCSYFWQIPFNMIFVAVLFYICALVIHILFVPYASLILWLINDYPFEFIQKYIGEISIIIQLAIVLVYSGDYLYHRFKQWKAKQPPLREDYTPSIIATYWHAWKKKYCLQLKFTDDPKGGPK